MDTKLENAPLPHSVHIESTKPKYDIPRDATWDTIRDYFVDSYTYIDPIELNVSCTVPGSTLAEIHRHNASSSNKKGLHASLSSIIDNFGTVQTMIRNHVSTDYELDANISNMVFFLDTVEVSNMRTSDGRTSAFPVRMSYELPYIYHTNTDAMRQINNKNHFRCIDKPMTKTEIQLMEKNDGIPSFCANSGRVLNIYGGIVQQTYLLTNTVSSTQLLNLDMKFNKKIDFGKDYNVSGVEEDVDHLRSDMLHLMYMLDNKNVYPDYEPRWSRTFNNEDGLTQQVHSHGKSYQTYWDKDLTDDQRRHVGAVFPMIEFASFSHGFFDMYSRCRMATFENSGIFFSMETPCEADLQFDLKLVLCPIVKVGEDGGPISVTTNKAVDTVTSTMKETKNSNQPFAK